MLLYAMVPFIALALILLATAESHAAPGTAGDGPSSRRLAAAWQTAIARTPRPATWTARQKAFEAPRDAASSEPPAARNDDALRRLETERRYAKAMPRTVRRLGKACIGRALRNCQVLGAGQLGPDLAWQSQRGFTPQDGLRGGIVLLERQRNGFKLVTWSFEGYDWQEPKLIAAADGSVLLTAAGRVAGTGAHNADLLYRRVGKDWREVELESWKDAIEARLPPGFGVWKGVDYDFAAMTAKMAVWRPNDANCCPTGGDAVASFRIDGDRLVLTGLQFTPHEATR